MGRRVRIGRLPHCEDTSFCARQNGHEGPCWNGNGEIKDLMERVRGLEAALKEAITAIGRVWQETRHHKVFIGLTRRVEEAEAQARRLAEAWFAGRSQKGGGE